MLHFAVSRYLRCPFLFKVTTKTIYRNIFNFEVSRENIEFEFNNFWSEMQFQKPWSVDIFTFSIFMSA